METFDREYLKELAHKYTEGTLTEKEQAYFDRWYDSRQEELLELPAGYAGSIDEIRDRMKSRIQSETGSGIRSNGAKVITAMWIRILVAASILVFFGILLIFYTHKGSQEQLTNLEPQPQFIPAGTNKAILTLGSGQRINLDDSGNGTIARQSGSVITKHSSGLIAYSTSSNPTATVVEYNTIATPRGGQYAVQLPDGTKVWLNAASSLRFPARFTGRERTVTLTGEGYFDVVHDKAHPFIVKTATQQVTDIGTSFNINAYSDEPQVATVLVEGAVAVSANGQHHSLKPGQQAVSTTAGLTVSSAEVQIATAWKQGQLAFHRTDIRSVLRQIARWYNIEIVYQGSVPDITISGGISRQEDLSAVLKILQLSEVHFIQQGRKLIITK